MLHSTEHELKWNWPSQFTFAGRYNTTGITDRFLEYVKISGKKKLKVLDVGCSVGIATNDMQKNLQSIGIQIETTGIDKSRKVKGEAEKNLSRFILGDILTLDSTSEFDVVICSKIILFANAKTRSQVVSKCAKFLKPDGGLITDADFYKIPGIIEQIRTDFKDYLPVLLSLRHGPKKFYRKIKDVESERLKRKMYLIVGRGNVDAYSIKILEGWQKLNIHDKFNLWLLNITNKLSAYTKRKPDYKKRK